MKPSNTTTSGKATNIIAGICTCPRLPCPCTTLHVMLNLTSAFSTGMCHTCSSALYLCSLLLSHFPFDEIYLWASSPLSVFLMLLLLLLVVLLPSVRFVYKIFFFIFCLMRYTDVCFFALSGVLFPRE